ncbi:MAG: ABC transporter ATP-binding protein [Chloroflexi bacterium]|nr:ABC transporter ATP-binding protein [Chloroflexota bacterium]
MPVNTFEEKDYSREGSTGKIFLRILKFMKPHWGWMALFLIAVILTSVIDAYLTYLSKRIIDEGIVVGNIPVLLNIIYQYGALVVFEAFTVFTFIYMVGFVGEKVRYDLRQKMFNHLQSLSLSYYNQTPVGWIMSRVTNDTERVAELETWGLLDSTWGVINIATSMYFMFRINSRLAWIVAAILPILLFVGIKFQTRILKQYRIVRKINSQITASYNENITGVRVIKALGRENENLREFSEESGSMYNASYRAAWISALFLPTVQLISSLALGGIIWYSGAQAQIGGISVGGMQAFLSYITSMMWPIQDLARVIAEMQRAIASAERIFTLIDTTPDVRDRPEAYDPGSIRGNIEFEKVSFWYESNTPVIKELSFMVHHGETIALVGSTGGGKTTIVNLICRFFEPKRGRILIDGKDYTDYSLSSIQSRIGVVLQTPHLFSGTIKENIAYGRLDATDQDIEAAARLTGAHDFIVKMEHGYDEQVGEGGVLLSVGQKQLISLARAVLSDPEIFIMDEATSSVDTLTEAALQHGIESIMQGRTTFIIAHRLSTIKNSDRIFVIENGQISEMGNHNELIKKKGKYYSLYTQQFRQEQEKKYNLLYQD